LDVNRLVEKSVLLNANLMKINQIHVNQNLSTNMPPLYGSEDQLLQVFMNIISNAAEAMSHKDGGTLTIETKQSKTAEEIEIIFADTGVGIPDSRLTQIFEPFFTTKKKGKGVGLGLSVAYGIIQDHKGSIKVESKPGEGTRFIITLPI
jgi:signal transduction histidine kinase